VAVKRVTGGAVRHVWAMGRMMIDGRWWVNGGPGVSGEWTHFGSAEGNTWTETETGTETETETGTETVTGTETETETETETANKGSGNFVLLRKRHHHQQQQQPHGAKPQAGPAQHDQPAAPITIRVCSRAPMPRMRAMSIWAQRD